MTSDDPVTTISVSLKETDDLPRRQIAEIVDVLGADGALALLAETRRVQDEGGIEVRDGTRRRTDGGVFFSLAKAQLPKADRNRIFRVRVPKAPGEPDSERAPSSPEASKPQAPASKPNPKPAPRHEEPPGAGRRRVVEVEVLRNFGKSGPTPEPVRAWSPPREERVKEPAPPPVEARPMRRIVTVAPVVKNEPPSTPETARERVREMVKGLSAGDQKRVLVDVLRELGGLAELEPKRAPEPKKAPPPPPPPPKAPESKGLDAAGRERVLAAVTDALGLSAADLAKVLYGEDTAGTKAKARTVLEKFRRS